MAPVHTTTASRRPSRRRDAAAQRGYYPRQRDTAVPSIQRERVPSTQTRQRLVCGGEVTLPPGWRPRSYHLSQNLIIQCFYYKTTQYFLVILIQSDCGRSPKNLKCVCVCVCVVWGVWVCGCVCVCVCGCGRCGACCAHSRCGCSGVCCGVCCGGVALPPRT